MKPGSDTVIWRYPYTPNPRQQVMHDCPAEEVLFGGAAGPGKTDGLLAVAVTTCLMIPGCKVLFFRRSFQELKDEILPRLRQRLPRTVATYNKQDHDFTFTNGSILRLGYMDAEDDVYRYFGAEYVLICWDELTLFLRSQYVLMRSRCRMAGPVAAAMRALGWVPRMLSATNPAGRGLSWVKRMFVDPSPGRDQVFWGGIDDGEPAGNRLRLCYIPALASDNPHLDLDTYDRKLAALDPIMQRALRYGDWDILKGVRFPQFRRSIHVIEPGTLPLSLAGYPRGVGVDYGLSAPFCALWGAVLPDGLVVVYRELYRKGLTAQGQAQLIVASEQDGERLPSRPIPVALDPACWTRASEQVIKPLAKDTPPEGSIAWFYRNTLGAAVVKARNDRVAGWQLVDHHLRVRGDGLPRLLIYSTCTNLIRTLPEQMRAKTNPEDMDTHGDDHAADALRYLLFLLVGGGTPRVSPGQRPDPGRPETAGLIDAVF